MMNESRWKRIAVAPGIVATPAANVQLLADEPVVLRFDRDLVPSE